MLSSKVTNNTLVILFTLKTLVHTFDVICICFLPLSMQQYRDCCSIFICLCLSRFTHFCSRKSVTAQCYQLIAIISNVTRSVNISFLQLTPNLKRYSTNPQKEGQGLFAQFFDDTREMKVAFTHYSFHSKSSLNIQYYNKLLHLREEGSKHHLLQGQNLACRISNCVWPADSCETKVKQQLFMYIKFIKCIPNDFL